MRYTLLLFIVDFWRYAYQFLVESITTVCVLGPCIPQNHLKMGLGWENPYQDGASLCCTLQNMTNPTTDKMMIRMTTVVTTAIMVSWFSTTY